MIGWSQFALDRHRFRTGFSYFHWSPAEVVKFAEEAWSKTAVPGAGETDLTRKVLVDIFPLGFMIPEVPLKELIEKGISPKARIETRQEGEDPYVSVYADWDECIQSGILPPQAKYCKIVCYSAEALLENGGTRTTDEPWEIVAVLASLKKIEYMDPLSMARNFLQKPGGTKSVYSAQEFAEAIYAHSLRNIKMKE